jgi:hypothetical protein
MAGLAGKIARLARSPQGRKLADRAQSYAKSPEGKRKIEQVRGRVPERGAKRP